MSKPIKRDPGGGKSFALTPGTDVITGTSSTDFFTATDTTLNASDSVDGGRGSNTFNLVVANESALLESYGIPAGATVSGIELLNLSWRPDDGDDWLYANVSNWAGLTAMGVVNTGSAEANANSIATQANVANLSVTGGGHTKIEDLAATDKLRTVTLERVTGNVDIVSDALTTLSLRDYDGKGIFGAEVMAAAGTRTLSVNLSEVSNTSLSDLTATTLSLNVASASQLAVLAPSATTLAVRGSGGLTLSQLDQTALTSIGGGTSTGGITVSEVLEPQVAFTGGSGADTVTLDATIATILMGKGDDTVNFTSAALGAGAVVSGGDGAADTMSMASGTAAAASASAAFGAAVSGFERLLLGETAAGSNDRINLVKLGGVNDVASAGTAGATAAQEIQSFTVSGSDPTGGSVLVGGVPVAIPANAYSWTVAEAIAAAKAQIIAANPAIADITAEYNMVAVIYHASAGNVPNIVVAQNPAGVTCGAVMTPVGGAAEVTEQQTVSLLAPNATGSLFVGGVEVPVAASETSAQTAARVAAALNATPPAGVASAAVAGDNVIVTFAAGSGNVADLVVSDPGNVIDPDPVVSQTRAYVPASAETQTVTVTSGTDTTGGSILVGGARIDLGPSLSVDQVAGHVIAAVADIQAATPAIESLAYHTGTDTLTFQYALAPGNVPPISVGNNASGVTFSAVAEIEAGYAGVDAGTLSLVNMATGSTFELTGANRGGISIDVIAASANPADAMTLKLTSASLLAGGRIAMADVEAVAIQIDNTSASKKFNDSLELADAAAKSITISGDAGLALTFTGTAVTTVDASGITTGNFSWTAGALQDAAVIRGGATGTNIVAWTDAGEAVTYTGGDGADQIDANHADNVISTGAGADYVSVGEGANTIDLGAGNDYILLGLGLNVVTGGDGADKYEVFVNTSGATFTTITDIAAGDKLSLYGTGLSTFVTAPVVLGSGALLRDYLDAAAADTQALSNNVVRWFQFEGDTYVMEDRSDEGSFVDGRDLVIRLAGVHDLSTASWSDPTGDLTIV